MSNKTPNNKTSEEKYVVVEMSNKKPKAKSIDLTEEKYNKKTCSISQETPMFLNNELNGENEDDLLTKNYETDKDLLKALNNNKAVSFNQYTKYFEEFIEKDEISSENEQLGKTLESLFSRDEDLIKTKKALAIAKSDSASYLVESALSLVRHIVTDKEFDDLIKDHPNEAFSESAMKSIKPTFNQMKEKLDSYVLRHSKESKK